MRWPSRKFLLSSATLAAGTWLAYLGKLDAPTSGLLVGVLTAYLTSNVGQKVVVK